MVYNEQMRTYFDTELDRRIMNRVVGDDFYFRNCRERLHKLNLFSDAHAVNLNVSVRVNVVTDSFILGVLRTDSGRTVQIFKTTDQELQVIYDRC